MEGVPSGARPENRENQGRNRLRRFWNSAKSVKFSGRIPGARGVKTENSWDFRPILSDFAFSEPKCENREGHFRRGRSVDFEGFGRIS